MKLIPISAASTWETEYRLKEDANYKEKRKVMNNFLKPLRDFTRDLSYHPWDLSLYKLILNENIRRAFRSSNSFLEINYSRFIVSKGKLPMPRYLSASSQEPGKILFTWNDNSGRREAHESDCLFVVLLDWNTKKWCFEVDGSQRMACQFEMPCYLFEGKKVQVWAGFVSSDCYHVSTSVWLGEVQITAVDERVRA